MKNKHIVVIKAASLTNEGALAEANRLSSLGYIDPVATGSIHVYEMPASGDVLEGHIEISGDMKRLRFIGIAELANTFFPISTFIRVDGQLDILSVQGFVNSILELNTGFVGFSYFHKEREQTGVFTIYNVGFVAR